MLGGLSHEQTVSTIILFDPVVGYRQTAWHVIGIVLDDDCQTAGCTETAELATVSV